MRCLIVLLLLTSIVGCAGSPAASRGMTARQFADANLSDMSLERLCKAKKKGCGMNRGEDPKYRSYCMMRKQAFIVELGKRNKSASYCGGGVEKNYLVWKDGKRPDPTTMTTCEQYSQLVYNHIMGNQTPPPMRDVVVVKQRQPTEYEGKITGCGMFSCTVELRETYRSKWSRQIQQTSDNLGQSYYEAGYAIGQALARSSLANKAEKEKEAKYTSCLRSAGYYKVWK